VRYRFADVPALLRTPVGRAKLAEGCFCHAWPLLSGLAGAYRRRVVPRTRIVAVVGSLGKTTTTRAVAAALGRRADMTERHNYSSYLAETLFSIRPGQTNAVIEVGVSKFGEMQRYASLLRPQVAVVTSIASEHNKAFGTLEGTRAEKVEMLRALPPTGLAVYNNDDHHVRWMASQTSARVCSYGLTAGSDVHASDVVLDWPGGTTFSLEAAGQTRLVRTRLLGRHMVYSILAAVAVGLEAGYSLDQVLPRLESLDPTPGRLERTTLANGAVVLRDDNKSTLESVDAALDVFAEVPAARRLVVLGEVDSPFPDLERQSYQRLGERVARLASLAVIVAREEIFQEYATGARQASLMPSGLVYAGPDVHAAVEPVRRVLQPGDVLLVKGRWGQRLDRLVLALQDKQVKCQIRTCDVRWRRCDRCPMLERGWRGLQVKT
jgi:UDP-N-acetylmuramoyl-tripeptide--D-alanyl-D-alanine ligase